MAQFEAGSVHTAKAPIHNPTSKRFEYTGMLFLGVDEVAKAEVGFWLDPNETAEIPFTVAMPSEVGEYPVYIGVFSGGVFLEPLRQGDNIVITAAPVLLPFTFSDISVDNPSCPLASAYQIPDFSGRVTNPNVDTITHTVRLWQREYSHSYSTWYNPWVITSQIITLAPGGSYTYRYYGYYRDSSGDWICYPNMFQHTTYYYWLEDELGNQSVKVTIYRP